MTEAKPAATPAAVGVTLTQDQCPQDAAAIKEMAQVPYRMLVGCLLWLSNSTRLDIAHATSVSNITIPCKPRTGPLDSSKKSAAIP